MTTAHALQVPLASIPSIGSPYIVDVGPFHLRWYGTLIAIGVLIAGSIAPRCAFSTMPAPL